jgi:hypothetical protein
MKKSQVEKLKINFKLKNEGFNRLIILQISAGFKNVILPEIWNPIKPSGFIEY